MEKALESTIETRCDSALQKNKDYTDLQEELAYAHKTNDIDAFGEISFRMQCIAVVSSYKMAIKDLHSIINE